MMSFKWLRQLFKRDEELSWVTEILELLKSKDNLVVKVKTYTGTYYFQGYGDFNSLKVFQLHFDTVAGIVKPTQPVYLTQNSSLLEYINQAFDYGNFSIEAAKNHTYSFEAFTDYVRHIVSRLRPGQGYFITDTIMVDTNWLTEHGEVIVTKNGKKYGFGEGMVMLDVFLPSIDLSKKFDPSKVTVADEKLIKREHRKFTDPKRWLVIKQVASIGDDWVISATANNTAEAPVYYYTVEVDINHHSVAGYPFYIKDLLQVAVDTILEYHPGFTLNLQDENILIKFKDGPSEPVFKWVERQKAYPKLKDSEPIIFYTKHDIRQKYEMVNLSNYTKKIELYEIKTA